jgi:hypothetical protein
MTPGREHGLDACAAACDHGGPPCRCRVRFGAEVMREYRQERVEGGADSAIGDVPRRALI